MIIRSSKASSLILTRELLKAIYTGITSPSKIKKAFLNTGADSVTIRKTIYYLRRKKLITQDPFGNIKLTVTGKQKAKIMELEDIKIKRPRKWDGKWRVLAFDIPTKYKKSRDALRNKLKELGFYQIQESIYIFPYECKKELQYLVSLYGIRPFVTFFTATELENDHKLIKKFNL